jgi:hypothetical protein
MGSGGKRKTPAPLVFYGRNSTESTVEPKTTPHTNIITMVVPFAPTTAWYLWICPIRHK